MWGSCFCLCVCRTRGFVLSRSTSARIICLYSYDSLILEDFCEWIQLYMTVTRMVCHSGCYDVFVYIYVVTFWKTVVPLFKKTASGDEAVCPFRTLVTFYQSAWSNIPDDLDHQQHHCQNIKSYSVWFVRFLNSYCTASVWHPLLPFFSVVLVSCVASHNGGICEITGMYWIFLCLHTVL